MRQTVVQSVTTITLVVVSILLNDVVLSFQPVSRILISTTTRYNQGLFSFLLQSTMNSDATSSNDEKRQTSEIVTQEKSIEKKRNEEKLAMPWSDIQNEALRDNIAKYTVMIPLLGCDKSRSESLWTLTAITCNVSPRWLLSTGSCCANMKGIPNPRAPDASLLVSA